jgi:myo-inositol-1(or 4)-monophosphatase
MGVTKDHGIENLTRFALDIIRDSGEEALTYYGKGKSNVKFDEELVIEAETRIMNFFQNRLHDHFPQHQVFRNNQADQDYTHDDKRYLWIYDPLDGIANFQAGIPIWGISLALIENFWPVLGVFYMPATGDLFYARAGQKAYWDKKEIWVSNQKLINDESLLLTFSRFHKRYHTSFPGKIRNLGCTGAHICYVAMGRADGVILANESYQDLAAAAIILEAAGGKICKIDGSDFHLSEYLDGQKINDHLLAVSPENFNQVKGCLTKIG